MYQMSLFGLMLINKVIPRLILPFCSTPKCIIIMDRTSSTYNLFEDQVTLAGKVYTDAMLENLYSGVNKTRRVFAYAVIPIENFAPSGTTNDYFYPNFIPTNLWSYGDVGVDYCAASDF